MSSHGVSVGTKILLYLSRMGSMSPAESIAEAAAMTPLHVTERDSVAGSKLESTNAAFTNIGLTSNWHPWEVDPGIFLPPEAVSHRDDEYDASTFELLRQMQAEHFWYRGRHRFLLSAWDWACRKTGWGKRTDLQVVDLGGGCGGWVDLLSREHPQRCQELALADSSREALLLARDVVGPRVTRYQIDLMHLQWTERWDAAFLLDVLEHIPDQQTVLKEIWQALRPGGLLLITTPALQQFWSYNDELVHHVRRYSRADYAALAQQCGFELLRSRYFMFFLSPLLLLSRWKSPDLKSMTAAEQQALLHRTHAVPAPLVNLALQLVFSAETPLGWHCPFPWGTSVLAILRKPL